jgi:hypothetical protein
MIMACGSEVVTFTGEGIGRFGSTGSSSRRGFAFFSTPSKGKLSFLNNWLEHLKVNLIRTGTLLIVLGNGNELILIPDHWASLILRDKVFAPSI